ncbi:hypothetical protein HK105_206627 [Polyrhizophydium stewartii]|uniref:GATA-type domain-containing protein n=1 Tax=Polyrhizophydium stewartii TaxID=2732419 RepID=A0ABR4N348_9FUNG|nr:hypothetical protein HK105_000591 [Polyrhizophydium stewartii]
MLAPLQPHAASAAESPSPGPLPSAAAELEGGLPPSKRRAWDADVEPEPSAPRTSSPAPSADAEIDVESCSPVLAPVSSAAYPDAHPGIGQPADNGLEPDADTAGASSADAIAGDDPASASSGASPSASPSATPPPSSAATAVESPSAPKYCHYCGATSTPMWRHGPGHYVNLCNSCGVKWRRGKILQSKQFRHPLCKISVKRGGGSGCVGLDSTPSPVSATPAAASRASDVDMDEPSSLGADARGAGHAESAAAKDGQDADKDDADRVKLEDVGDDSMPSTDTPMERRTRLRTRSLAVGDAEQVSGGSADHVRTPRARRLSRSTTRRASTSAVLGGYGLKAGLLTQSVIEPDEPGDLDTQLSRLLAVKTEMVGPEAHLAATESALVSRQALVASPKSLDCEAAGLPTPILDHASSGSASGPPAAPTTLPHNTAAPPSLPTPAQAMPPARPRSRTKSGCEPRRRSVSKATRPSLAGGPVRQRSLSLMEVDDDDVLAAAASGDRPPAARARRRPRTKSLTAAAHAGAAAHGPLSPVTPTQEFAARVGMAFSSACVAAAAVAAVAAAASASGPACAAAAGPCMPGPHDLYASPPLSGDPRGPGAQLAGACASGLPAGRPHPAATHPYMQLPLGSGSATASTVSTPESDISLGKAALSNKSPTLVPSGSTVSSGSPTQASDSPQLALPSATVVSSAAACEPQPGFMVACSPTTLSGQEAGQGQGLQAIQQTARAAETPSSAAVGPLIPPPPPPPPPVITLRLPKAPVSRSGTAPLAGPGRSAARPQSRSRITKPARRSSTSMLMPGAADPLHAPTVATNGFVEPAPASAPATEAPSAAMTAAARTLRTQEFATLLRLVPGDKVPGLVEILMGDLDEAARGAVGRGEQVAVSVMHLGQTTWGKLWTYARGLN